MKWLRFPEGIIPFNTIEAARSAPMMGWRIPVAASWFTVALCVLLALSDALTFTYHSTSGITGWVSNNHYPKQQELFWFLSAVAGIPAVMLGGWILWISGAAGLARLTRQPPEIVLKISAACHLPLLLAWSRIGHLRADAWKLLPPAVGAGLLLCILSILFVRFILPKFQRFQVRGHDAEAIPWKYAQEAPARPRPGQRGMIHLTWRITVCLTLYLAIPTLLYLLRVNVNYNGAVDFFHDGEFLIPLDEVMHGSVPYRDIYLQQGLFNNVLIPLLGAKIFEPTLAGVREIIAYVEPLGVVAFYFFLMAICRARFLVAAFLIFVCCGSIAWMSARGAFGLLSLAVIAMSLAPARGFEILSGPQVEADQRPKLRELPVLCLRQGWPFLLSGSLAMLAFWHSVESGLFSLATGLVFLSMAGLLQSDIRLWRRILPAALYCIGALIAFAPFGAYFAAHGAFTDMVRNVWIQCVYQTDTWGLAFPNFLELFRPILVGPVHPQWPDWLISGKIQWYFGVICLVPAAAYLAFRAMGGDFWRSRTIHVLLLITLAGTIFFRTELGRSDRSHIYYGVLFALALAIFTADRLLATGWDRFTAGEGQTRSRFLSLPWFLSGLAVAACLVWLSNTAFRPIPALKTHWARLQQWPDQPSSKTEMVSRAGKAVIPEDQAEQIRGVSKYIVEHSRPDERIFDFSSQAGLLFFAGRRGATRYFQVSYASPPAVQDEVVRDLERLQVPLVIFRSGTVWDALDGVPVEKRHPVIAAYLHAKYEPADTIGPVVFWKRKSSPEQASKASQ
jgi:hypothetical protein